MVILADNYATNNPYGKSYKSEEAKDFDDRMEFIEITDFYRGADRVKIKSVTSGRMYCMFICDFNDCLKAKRLIDNHLEGTFRFVKKGVGQGIKLILPDTTK